MSGNKISLRRRTFIVFVCLMCAFLLLGVRLAYVQLVQGSELQQKAENMRTRDLSVAAKRGVIYDRNGKKLAMSLSADSIYANPATVIKSKKAENTATFLAETLEMDYAKVLKKITSNNSFEWVKRKTSYEAAQKIREADLPGIDIVEETRRFYPKDMLAAHVLGFAGIDNQGLDGLELSLNEVLSGKPGSIVTEYDSKGVEIPQAVKEYNPPTDGQSVVLTIDENLQFFAERELDKLMSSETPPKACTILMMNPKTGEILAMANRPAYNPNTYGSYDSLSLRNKAVIDIYEPGSTFKMVTCSAALDSGAATMNSHFYCPGYIQVGKTKMKCWRSYNPHGSQDLSQIMQNSCNPGLASLALSIEKMSKGTYYDYIRKFGFGQKTGVSLPGESSGLMIKEENLIPLNIANIAIGQSIAVTPLQMITAGSAVVNGGIRLEPQIVKQVLDQEGNVVQDFQVKKVEQVISADTSAKMRTILESVVTKGTAKNAYVEGYRVGGKTGTSQKVGERGYEDGKYVASFLGFAPINDPQLAALVIIDEPSSALYQGGQIAAPVFSALMQDCLRYLGVTAQTDLTAKEDLDETTEKTMVSVPDVVNLAVAEAKKVLTVAGLTVQIKGDGEIVTSQTPAGFSNVISGTKVILNTGPKNAKSGAQVTVPDLTGKRVREVAEILSAMGLSVKTSGAGTVFEQQPIPGTKVQPGDVINVTFAVEDQTQPVVGP